MGWGDTLDRERREGRDSESGRERGLGPQGGVLPRKRCDTVLRMHSFIVLSRTAAHQCPNRHPLSATVPTQSSVAALVVEPCR